MIRRLFKRLARRWDCFRWGHLDENHGPVPLSARPGERLSRTRYVCTHCGRVWLSLPHLGMGWPPPPEGPSSIRNVSVGYTFKVPPGPRQ